MNRFIKLLLLVLITESSLGQTTSVFDANYFESDGSIAPVKIGKGFNVNDIFKQTKTCFTAESCAKSKLVSNSTGGKKTQIKLFYTKTNHDYNQLIKKGGSGRVSFLNLFSIGGERLKQFSSDISEEQERLIFTINVDFGVFSFANDPILNLEAEGLIKQKKAQEFVRLFGTHYISGIRKESFVSVVLTKTGTKESTNLYNDNSVNVGVNLPTKVSGGFEINNGSWVNKELQSNEFSVTVNINGPGIDSGEIQSKVIEILNGNSQTKSDAITSVISSAVKNISNADLSGISQYYYTPFELYGLEEINWDQDKVEQLEKINDVVIDLYQSKATLEELNSKQTFLDEIQTQGVPEQYLIYFSDQYDKSLPRFKELLQKANFYFSELEKRYKKCNDVLCNDNATCCNNDSFLNEIKEYDFNKQIEDSFVVFVDIYQQVAEIIKQQNTPSCVKNNNGTITIRNKSINPYYLYNGDKLIETLAGKTSKSFSVNIGTYNFKAVQKSGYALYATINNRTATISKACDEVILEVGFED